MSMIGKEKTELTAQSKALKTAINQTKIPKNQNQLKKIQNHTEFSCTK
jgi:hypothetical protein